MGLRDTEEVVKTLLGLTPQQWAVVVFLIVGAVSAAFWVENRYAKIQETRSDIERTQMEIMRHKDEILQMHFKTLELIRLQPPAVQAQIERNAKATHEQYMRLQRDIKPQ